MYDPTTWDAVPPGWQVDWGFYPKGYGMLANEHLMFPVDMTDWPVKIDVSRQLFLDDYLLVGTKSIVREVHAVTRYPANPLIAPDRPWEASGVWLPIVHRDKVTGRYRMWYAGWARHRLPSGVSVRYPGCYAESEDGLTWKKPGLGLYGFEKIPASKTNIINPAGNPFGVFLEPDEPDPAQRYKGLFWHEQPYVKREGYFLYASPDGLRWKRLRKDPVLPMGARWQPFPPRGIGDAVYFYRDHRRGTYVANAKVLVRRVPRRDQLDNDKLRMRAFTTLESDDLIHWTRPRMILYPDALDGHDAQIYRNAPFAYESMWIGFLSKMEMLRRGSKTTEVQLSASRDGRHWTRVGRREPFLPLGKPGQWDAAYQAPAIPPILVDQTLRIYYRSAPSRKRGVRAKDYIGLATLRRDGFVSLNAGDKPGIIETRPLTFAGKGLYVNADVQPGGYIKAELRLRRAGNKPGRPIKPYTLANCKPVTGDVMAGRITWSGKAAIKRPNDQSWQLLLELRNAKLYSFWIE